MKRYNILNTLLILVAYTISCKNDNSSYKPRGYFILKYPKNEYIIYEDINNKFYLKISKFSHVKLFRSNKISYEIFYPLNNCSIYLTYLNINSKYDLIKYIKDNEKFVYNQSIKASYIKSQNYLDNTNKIFSTLYKLGGDVALNYQFHITDSIKNFIRGSVYFNCIPNEDSLLPSINYIEKDINNIIKTFRWNN